MGWFNKNSSQQIDGTVSGENNNANEATGSRDLCLRGRCRHARTPDDMRDCYQRGGCSSCKKRPDYCAIAQQYLPNDAIAATEARAAHEP